MTAETVYAVAGDSTLTAVWTISPYVLTLDANGGAVEPDKISVFYGAAVGELPVPTREGYTFDGWYDANGTLVKADSLYTTAGNSTLTAKWTGKQYTLTLDPGNGKKSTEITVTYGSPVGKLPTPTRDGYKFVGWYDKDGNAVTADTVYNTAGNLTLKAKWVSNSANPATGDNSPLYLTSALFVLSAAALAVLFAEYKRRVKR